MLARFKSLLLTLITLFRRALCCFSRRRKASFSDCEILTSVNVQSNNSRHRNEVKSEDLIVEVYIEMFKKNIF